MFHSLALNESTDQTDTTQLAIFVREVDRNFNIHVFEKLLSIASLKDRTTGKDYFKRLKKAIKLNNLRFKNIALHSYKRSSSHEWSVLVW